MEVIKISNLKAVKQTIELENQGKIKLDIYESLLEAHRYKSIKIFDLLIKTCYESINFNKKIIFHSIIYYIIMIKSKYLNFILSNVKINNLNIYSIFNTLCEYGTLKSVKIFTSIYSVKELIFKKNSYGYTPLDYACLNRLNIVKYLLKFIKSINSNLIDSNLIDSKLINMDRLLKNGKENIIKYLLENFKFKFNLNKQDEYGFTIIGYINNLNIIKMLFKYDGNIDLENKNKFNHTPIENIINSIKIHKFLAKYTKPYNITFEDPEIFKFNIKN